MQQNCLRIEFCVCTNFHVPSEWITLYAWESGLDQKQNVSFCLFAHDFRRFLTMISASTRTLLVALHRMSYRQIVSLPLRFNPKRSRICLCRKWNRQMMTGFESKAVIIIQNCLFDWNKTLDFGGAHVQCSHCNSNLFAYSRHRRWRLCAHFTCSMSSLLQTVKGRWNCSTFAFAYTCVQKNAHGCTIVLVCVFVLIVARLFRAIKSVVVAVLRRLRASDLFLF